jgi:hypothetical protein
MKILQARSEFVRNVAKIPDVLLRNRFIELNPVLQEGEQPYSYIQRPALHYWMSVGTGPIRSVFHAAGAFNDDMFVVSFDTLYRVDAFKNSTAIALNLFGADDPGSPVAFACTGEIGDIPNRLFFADGQTLRVYTDDGFATGTLTTTAVPSNGDVVEMGGTYYQFTTGSVDAGTPLGTVAFPWLVAINLASATATLDNLLAALNGTGTAGTQYSTATIPNTDVAGEASTSGFLRVRALEAGVFGNAITTTETGANMSWGAATLQNGGVPGTFQIATPNDIGVISVAFINGYVIVVPAQGEGVDGRFYWIQPGETTIDPLDFATAERSADPIFKVVVFGDQFWLPGQTTTETWYISGDPDAPVARVQGILFDRGTIAGTGRQVKDSLLIVDNDGGVFKIRGGQEQRISTPDIEERIRKAIAATAV